MKYQNLENEFNDLLDSAAKLQRERQKKIKFFLEQFKAEEKKLHHKLKKENAKSNRKKLIKELRIVNKGYAILAA